MAMFLIERNFAEQLNMTPEIAGKITEVKNDMGVRWLYSFLSADQKKTYCLYEAPSAESMRENARRLNMPADVVVQVSDLKPEMFT